MFVGAGSGGVRLHVDPEAEVLLSPAAVRRLADSVLMFATFTPPYARGRRVDCMQAGQVCRVTAASDGTVTLAVGVGDGTSEAKIGHEEMPGLDLARELLRELRELEQGPPDDVPPSSW